jgi:hypothetical protein
VQSNDINTLSSPVHSRWMTLRRFKRERSPDGSSI